MLVSIISADRLLCVGVYAVSVISVETSVHDHRGVGDYVYVVLVDEECVWSADMSFVMWYSGLEAVLSGRVCVGGVVHQG